MIQLPASHTPGVLMKIYQLPNRNSCMAGPPTCPLHKQLAVVVRCLRALATYDEFQIAVTATSGHEAVPFEQVDQVVGNDVAVIIGDTRLELDANAKAKLWTRSTHVSTNPTKKQNVSISVPDREAA